MIERARASGLLRDIVACAGVACVLAAAYTAFFGRYAFDDSYVGYGIAQSILSGHGFTFNVNQRLLSTSAPLAVPIYALLGLIFGTSVVSVAQFVSASALAVTGFGTYALLRRLCSPAGAFAGAAIVLSSPFTVLLWSHETLLYLALSIVALNLFAANRVWASAIVAGLVPLLRAEALIVLPFFWIAQWRRSDLRSAAAFAAVSIAPFVLWSIWATTYFGTFLSSTVAAKHAELRYDRVLAYLPGLWGYSTYLYAFSNSLLWPHLLELAVLATIVACIACRLVPRPFLYLAIWVVGQTAIYVVLALPFYFWFVVQIGVALGACAAMPWTDNAQHRLPLVAAIGRVAAAAIVCLNLAFLGGEILQAQRGPFHGPAVLPNISDNPYKTLGRWFAAHASSGQTIAYPEFGQIRYYSGHDVVDYLGLVTPGAAQQLDRGNAIWSFKYYRPGWYVESPTWHFFVNPLEYDWFRAAYVPVTAVLYPGDPDRDRFTVYRLQSPQLVPPPDERSANSTVLRVTSNSRDLDFVFTTAENMTEVEARVRSLSPCDAKVALIGRRELLQRDEILPPGITRVSMHVASAPAGQYRLSLSGCKLAAAPPVLLRAGYPRFDSPHTRIGSVADALTVYNGSNAGRSR